MDLRKAIMDGVDFMDLCHIRANFLFNEASLKGANFKDVCLMYSDLSGADLRGAIFTCADLGVCDLSDADLRGAELTHADLFRTCLERTNLSDAKLCGVHGDGRRIKSMVIDLYYIAYTTDVLWINNVSHKIEDWWEFSDAEIEKCEIELDWWRKMKPMLKNTIELSPAAPPSYKFWVW